MTVSQTQQLHYTTATPTHPYSLGERLEVARVGRVDLHHSGNGTQNSNASSLGTSPIFWATTAHNTMIIVKFILQDDYLHKTR